MAVRSCSRLYSCGCHESPLDTTWFQLVKSTKKAHYMCQISNQSDEWCQKWRGGVRLTLPPLCLRVTFVGLCLLGLRLLFSLKPKEMAKMRFLAIWIDQK